jgi:phosphoglycolate phosphatase
MQVHFDFDGVLVDSLDILFDLFKRTWCALGAGREPRMRDLTHTPNLTFPHVAARLGIPPDRRDEYLRNIMALQATDAPIPPLFPGMRQVLERLALSHRLNVVSASSRSAIESALETNGVIHLFHRVCGAEDGDSKSEVIGALQRKSSPGGGKGILIGDTVGDIRQGRTAGAITMAVTWGYQASERLASENPDYLLHQPGEIPRAVEKAAARNRVGGHP